MKQDMERFAARQQAAAAASGSSNSSSRSTEQQVCEPAAARRACDTEEMGTNTAYADMGDDVLSQVVCCFCCC